MEASVSAAAVTTRVEPSKRASPRRARAAVGPVPPPSIDLCDGDRLVCLEEATRRVHHEEPNRVNAPIGEFLGGCRGDLPRRARAPNP